MGAAFGWVGEIMAWVWDLIPRFLVCRTTHAGVAWVAGKHVRVIRPGLFWYWPPITESELIPVVRQTLDWPSQTLTTRDEVPVAISAIIQYEVVDVRLALTSQYDLDDTLQDMCKAAVRDFVSAHDFNQILLSGDGMKVPDNRLFREVEANLGPYGVKVLRVEITDYAKTRVNTQIMPDGGGGATIIDMGDDDE